MSRAPEMSPNLDDAIQSLDRVLRATPTSAASVELVRVCRFLDQLDEVRNVPAVVLDRAQAQAVEGAYQAGFRPVDESGHVLVVSLPALLAHVNPVAARPRVPRWVTAAYGPLALVMAALVAVGQAPDAAGVMFLAAVTHLVAAVLGRLPESPCNQDCAQGTKCPSRSDVAKQAAAWEQRAREAERQVVTLKQLASCPISGLPSEFLRTQGGAAHGN